MAKGGSNKKLEQQLAELNAVRDDPDRPEARELLALALQSGRAALVTVAANIIAEAELQGFGPALRAAFERHLSDAVKSDPGCAAKTAAARALYKLGERASDDVYLP